MLIELWLITAVYGALFGLLGQGIRVAVGLYKSFEKGISFQLSKLLFSLLLGALAGSCAALFVQMGTIVSLEQVFAILVAGYAGSDFLEGLIGAYSKK